MGAIAIWIIGMLVGKLLIRIPLLGASGTFIGRELATWIMQLFETLRKYITEQMKVHCIIDKVECKYKEQGCYIEKTYGAKWTAEQISNCPFRDKPVLPNEFGATESPQK